MLTNAYTGHPMTLRAGWITGLAYTGTGEGSTICLTGPTMSDGVGMTLHFPIRESRRQVRRVLARARRADSTVE
jgi:hypothetical protein